MNRFRTSISFIVSMVVHIALAAFLYSMEHKKQKEPTTLEFSVHKPKPEPVVEEIIEKELEKPKPKPKPKPKLKKKKSKPKVKKVEKPPEIKEQPPLEPKFEEQVEQLEKKAPVTAIPIAGISMTSTVKGGGSGGFSVRVGNTLMAKASKEFVKPEDVKRLDYNSKPTPLAIVSTMPRLLKDFKVPYPEAARHDGVEGKVVMELEILRNGRVGKAKLLKGIGYGLDEAALAARNEVISASV